MASNDISYFRVSHCGHELGKAIMHGRRVSYKADSKDYSWFEARDDAWLRDFQAIVRKLCRSVGHTSIYSISQDIDSGIEVKRL